MCSLKRQKCKLQFYLLSQGLATKISMKIAKILQVAGRKLTWTHREPKHAEQQLLREHRSAGTDRAAGRNLLKSCTFHALALLSVSVKQQKCVKTETVRACMNTRSISENLLAALPDFSIVLAQRLHCTQLHSDNFYTYTPTHTNMSWHTLIALNQVSICMQKPPRRALMNLPN